MTDDPLKRYGSLLHDELREAAGPPRPVEALRRRNTTRRAAGTLVAVALVAIAVVGIPQLVGGPSGLVVEPLAPGEVVDSTEDGRDEDGGEAAVGVEVRPLGLETPVALRLLAVRFNDASVAVIDLDPGERTMYPPGAHALSGDALGGGLVLSDDTVVAWQDGTIRIFRDGLDDEPLVHTPARLTNPPGAAPSLRVVPTADEAALWVVQIGACCPDAIDGTAERLEVSTGEVTVTAQLPPNSFPVVATDSGMLFNTRQVIEATELEGAGTEDGWVDEPDSQRILHADRDGVVRELADGEVFAVSGETMLVRTCETDTLSGVCELELIDIVSNDRRPVPKPTEGEWTQVNEPVVPGDHSPWNATAPDGRILAAIAVRSPGDQEPSETHLVTIAPDTGAATPIHRHDGPPGPAAWDRTGTYLVLADGRDLTVIDPAAGTTETLRDVIPEDHYLIATG